MSFVQWCQPPAQSVAPKVLSEKYNPAFNHISSVEAAIRWLDSTAAANHISSPSRAYVDLADSLIRQRFFHSYSYYSLGDDYISYFLGRFVWSDLSAIVDADDILKFNYAACSQQSIAFMSVLKQKGYRTRKVGLKGHFCTGVFYEGSWHFYDPNREPSFSKSSPIPSTLQLVANKRLLYKAYAKILEKKQLDVIFSEVKFEETHLLPGYRMRFFHKVTWFLSNFLWAVFAFLYLFSFVVERHFWVKYVRYSRVPVVQ